MNRIQIKEGAKLETVIFWLVFFMDVIRYISNVIFSFNAYIPRNKNINIKNYPIKRACKCVAFYTLILSTSKYIINGPAIPFISTLVLFIWFWISNKDLKQWQFPLTFSLFISSVIECTYILSYKTVVFILAFFNIFDTSEDYIYDENLLFWRTSVTITYFILLFLIHKSKLIDLKIIHQVSKNKMVPIFLILYLMWTIYLKFNLKNLDDTTRLMLSNIFLFFPIVLLVLIIIISKYTKKISKMQNKIKINTALEDAKNRKGEGTSGLYFTVEKHKLEVEHFEKILRKLRMNLESIGREQAIFAAVLLKNYDNPQRVELNKDIFAPIADIVGTIPKTIYRNIEYFIEKNFNQFKLGEIEKFYKGPISEKKSVPTPSQFLFYLVKKCKEEELNDKNDIISDV